MAHAETETRSTNQGLALVAAGFDSETDPETEKESLLGLPVSCSSHSCWAMKRGCWLCWLRGRGREREVSQKRKKTGSVGQ